MFKRPNKQLFILRRVILSIVATISVLIIVTVSILFMLGYRLDGGNGRLEQGALLQFDSRPSGADVWIDDKRLSSQTATKQTVLAGVHTVKMTKFGYEDWSRTLTLDAGTLTWLDYIRFVPTDRPVEPVASYKSLAGLTFSPDLQWALALEDQSNPTFELIDLRSENVKTSELTLPSDLYSKATNPKTSKFSMYRWNSDGRYIIIQHAYDKSSEWLMVDTQDLRRSENITRMMSVGFKDMQFTGTSGMNLYGLTSDNVVRKLDLSAETISRALVRNVSSFSVYEDTSTISYVGTDANDKTKKVAGIYKDGETDSTVLRTASESNAPLAIALGRYFGDTYVAIAEGTKVDILTGTLPSANTKDPTGLRNHASFSLTDNVTALSFSPAADYVLAQSGAQFVTFEVEHLRSAMGTIDTAEGKSATALRWLDEAYLWNDDNNSLIMRDFDSSNIHTIMPVATGFDASLSTNGRFFYAVGKTDTGYQLQRIRMILN